MVSQTTEFVFFYRIDQLCRGKLLLDLCACIIHCLPSRTANDKLHQICFGGSFAVSSSRLSAISFDTRVGFLYPYMVAAFLALAKCVSDDAGNYFHSQRLLVAAIFTRLEYGESRMALVAGAAEFSPAPDLRELG